MSAKPSSRTSWISGAALALTALGVTATTPSSAQAYTSDPLVFHTEANPRQILSVWRESKDFAEMAKNLKGFEREWKGEAVSREEWLIGKFMLKRLAYTETKYFTQGQSTVISIAKMRKWKRGEAKHDIKPFNGCIKAEFVASGEHRGKTKVSMIFDIRLDAAGWQGGKNADGKVAERMLAQMAESMITKLDGKKVQDYSGALPMFKSSDASPLCGKL